MSSLATCMYQLVDSESKYFCHHNQYSPLGRRQESYLPVSRLYKEYAQELKYKWLILRLRVTVHPRKGIPHSQ